MKIKDMFVKPIDRNINGVVVVGDNDQSDIKQELEEYVVTKELLKHMSELFDNYKTGITGPTKKTGVWISGFFGSGKSHFLKMISYLLQNKNVAGKDAIDYFKDDQKIKDATVLADIELAANTPTDVILFNIDSKAEQTGKQKDDVLLKVFLKVFNEMQGFFGTMPRVADLEKELSLQGKYDTFKEKFKENYGSDWESSRQKFDFIQDFIVDTLVDINFMEEPSARNWAERAIQDYEISIEDFVQRVVDYLDSKGPNHHIVFLVDEVGQFIGDNSSLMLNLQTIAEELGKQSKGRAWVMVTSQQDIDSITKVKGDDFSKIQGRFDTRLSLTSTNVDEVIKERILKKNKTAIDTLKVLYENNETAIKNRIRFDDTSEMKLYTDETDFAQIYPFVPYQFNLLQKVLNSIREHGATGKHLSEGERSMLSLFKESAEKLKNEEEGALVALYQFYDALENFIEPLHARVISQALNNSRINPNNEDDNFNVNVLKTLFLIKYVKELENSTLSNITSLMISNINDDRLELEKKVEEALRILERETLIQKHQNKYVFLTEEEQEIGREIEKEQIDIGEVIQSLGELLYEDIYTVNRYKLPINNGRYTFGFNHKIDDRFFGRANNEIGLRIVTPYNDNYESLETLKALSLQNPEVIVVLPNENTDYIDELEKSLKIKNYLKRNRSNLEERHREILHKKDLEQHERERNAKSSLEDALNNATIFVNGNKLNNRVFNETVNEALGQIVEKVYNRLEYINTYYNTNDVQKMFENRLEFSNIGEPNQPAQNALLNDIKLKTNNGTKINLKWILDKYTAAPYGFLPDDIYWLIARLLKREEIELELNNRKISIYSSTPDELAKAITGKQNSERLLISTKKHLDQNLINFARKFSREIFDVRLTNQKEEEIIDNLKKNFEKLENKLRILSSESQLKGYPGSKVIKNGLDLITNIRYIEENQELLERINSDFGTWLDFIDDFEDVKNFYNSEKQKEIFDNGLKIHSDIETNRLYIDNEELLDLNKELEEILKADSPYHLIHKIPDLRDRINHEYLAVLKKYKENTKDSIQNDFEFITNQTLNLTEENKRKINLKQFDYFLQQVDNENRLANIEGYKNNSKSVRYNLSDQINELYELQKTELINETEDVDEVEEVLRKSIKTIRLSTIFPENEIVLNSEEDIQRYLKKLEARLINSLDENTEIWLTLN